MLAKPKVDAPPAAAYGEITSKPKRWTRFHQLLHDDKGLRYFFMALGVIIAVGLVLLMILSNHTEPNIPAVYVPQKTQDAPKYYSQLTGLEVADEASATRPVTAIMIENSPEARPQSGLKQAGIVYEAVTEGGITRFIALYQEARPGLVGPVRSLRPHFVEWAGPYDAAVAHVGGSKQALEMIRANRNYGLDIDQFFNAGSYWRSTDRSAPHNVYTSFDKLDELKTAKGKTSSAFESFKRKNPQKADTPTATSIAIDVSSGQFHVKYTYDAETNSYKRSQGGNDHIDREDGQIKPRVVIAIKVPIEQVTNDGVRAQITTSGNGEAYLFQDGVVRECTWMRGSDPTSPLRITTADGQDIELNRGQTWITALANTRSVSWQ